MKLRVLLIGALVAGMFAGVQESNAQIYTFFRSTIDNTPYQGLSSSDALAHSSFVNSATRRLDRNDGYYFANGEFGLSLGFANGFEFDGQRYDNIQVNVNGFLMFGAEPPLLGANAPERLFAPSAPNAVIAPFWGDHYLRIDSDRDDKNLPYIPSQIRVRTEVENDVNVFIVEWHKLNINHMFDSNDPDNPFADDVRSHRTSVGTFMVKIYESSEVGEAPQGKQGQIEFHYSVVGDPNAPGVIKTSGSTVGIESNAALGGTTTSMNGLFIDDVTSMAYDPQIDGKENVRNSAERTSTWSPSRANNNTIVYFSTPRPGVAGWGDGDANMTHVPGGIHEIEPQNIFVTISDVLAILRATATNQPLDSLILRDAYHGDVNHNGRYFYSTRTQDNTADSIVMDSENNPVVVTWRRDVPTKSSNEFDDIPSDNSFNALYFEATPFDAALILNYIGGQVPVLPWLLDDIIMGKAGVETSASEVAFAQAQALGGNSYRIPVFANGTVSGALAADFTVNAEIIDVEAVEANDNKVVAVSSDNRVAIAGSGVFTAEEPIAYVVVATDATEVKFNDIRFNDSKSNDASIMVADVETTEAVAAYPNPFTNSTSVEFAVAQDGFYTVNIFDMNGAVVETLHNGDLKAGNVSFNWNGTDAQGADVAAGTYIFRVSGNGNVVSGKVTLVK